MPASYGTSSMLAGYISDFMPARWSTDLCLSGVGSTDMSMSSVVLHMPAIYGTDPYLLGIALTLTTGCSTDLCLSGVLLIYACRV